MLEIPIHRKLNLTVEEAKKYSGIGINRIRALMDEPDCDFVLNVGTHKLIKREKFEIYILTRNYI